MQCFSYIKQSRLPLLNAHGFKDVRHHEIHTPELLLGPTQSSVCNSEMAIEKYRRHIGLSLDINQTLTFRRLTSTIVDVPDR